MTSENVKADVVSGSDPKNVEQSNIVAKVLKDMEPTKKILEGLAKAAEVGERYKDMCQFMKASVELSAKADPAPEAGKMLSKDEKNYLSVAYKNVVGALRSSWRTIAVNPNNDPLTVAYKTKLEDELETMINEILGLLKTLVKNAEDAENKEISVFYLKMTGDYHRYMAEFKVEDDTHKTKTEEFYKKAMDVAKEHLPETHPTRLGLALNFSVCYYEILKKQEKACELAKEAFDAAIEKLDTLNDASYKDSTLIMQLLRDNLTLWTADNNNAEADPANP